MLPSVKKRIIDNCVYETIKIHYEDEFFGKTIFTFKNYKVILSDNKKTRISDNNKTLELEFDNIVKIETDLSIDKRVELIEQSETLEEGISYTSEEITSQEQVALEILQDKLLPQSIERNIQLLKDKIRRFNDSFKGVESILSNLLVNICENGKIVTASQNERLLQITDKDIEKIIKKYEEEIF